MTKSPASRSPTLLDVSAAPRRRGASSSSPASPGAPAPTLAGLAVSGGLLSRPGNDPSRPVSSFLVGQEYGRELYLPPDAMWLIMSAAIQLSIQVAQLDAKQLYIPLVMDKGHWSRVMAGNLSFPAEKLPMLMDLTGNDIPLQWLAFQRGKGLHLLESEQQRQIRERDDRLAKQAEKIAYLEELITGRGK